MPETRFSETLPEWICAHVDTFAYPCGLLKAIVCDNLEAGAMAANRYEPVVNQSGSPIQIPLR